jgi:hypothetical protein
VKLTLQERSLDWALHHLCRYGDSDFFPHMLELDAIRANWEEVKTHILGINLEGYVPQRPLVRFAPKLSGNYRMVHRLDPIDSLVYTAMVHGIHETAGNSSVAAIELSDNGIQLQSLPEYQTAASVYLIHFNRAVNGDPPDLLSGRS